jgi:crotonobetainyl-CoA:carnitine CoA-transferase CaiB-like acyl-CoA transferase
VIVSYKEGDAERLGVDWETLSGLNPQLVYAEITAYGESDPRVGYDAVIQAETGFTSMNGTEESGPLKMPVALMDLLAGHQLKEGILSALLERERSGRGHRVSVSLFDSGVTALANQASNCLMTGAVPERLGSAHPNIAPYGTSYRCRDGGFVVLAVGTDSQFSRLTRCLDEAALSADPRFATNEARIRHRADLEILLADRISELDRDTLVTRLRAEGVPAGAVRNVREALHDPLSERLVLACSGTSAVRTRAFGIDDRPAKDPTPPPALSEHAHRILTDLLGYREERVEALAAGGGVSILDRGDCA